MSKSTSFARKSAGPSSLLSHSLFTIQLLFALQPLQAHPQSLAHSSQLQPSAFSPSSLQHTYTSTHTHHRKMSHLTNSKWHKTLLPPIHSIRDYDALTMCQAQNTELRVRSQTWSTLLHLEVYSQGSDLWIVTSWVHGESLETDIGRQNCQRSGSPSLLHPE